MEGHEYEHDYSLSRQKYTKNKW